MAATGKYTSYVGGGAPTPAHTLLSKLYPAGPFAAQVANADEKSALKDVVLPAAIKKVDAQGVGGLLPADGIQKGDTTTLGTVNLNFADAPDLTKVTHATAVTPSGNEAGGPANAYVPDITSPGPGKTDGVDKVADPGIAVVDLPGKSGYVAGGPTTSTRNPLLKSPAIVEANKLDGTSSKKGDSGANG